MSYLEIAEIDVVPGQESLFIQAVAEAVPLFKRAKGCLSLELRDTHEVSSRFRLMVEWETLEDHTVGFRESDDYVAWRALASKYFADVPRVEHAAQVLKGF